MTSIVDICNLALSHVRGGSINSIDENSTQAVQCRLHYPILLQQITQDSPWQFASAIKPLSLLIEEIFGWGYVYQYPTDCLRINRIIPDFSLVDSVDRSSVVYYRNNDELAPQLGRIPSVEYKIFNSSGNKVITANYPDLRIDYRVAITDPTLFSADFTLALSHLLASHLAIPIVGVDKGVPLRRESMEIYQRYLNSGIVNEMNEQHTNIPDSDFITIRT
jgi:hypothetical protein